MDQVRRWMEMARLPVAGETQMQLGAHQAAGTQPCMGGGADSVGQMPGLSQQQMSFLTGSLSQTDAALVAMAGMVSANGAQSALAGAAGGGAAANMGYGNADPAQLAQYANYVAALQLQQAAMANLGVQAGSQYGSGFGGDHPLGPRIWHLAADNNERTMGSRGLRDGPAQPHDPNRRFVGSVFKWDDDAGWGFLSCLEARKVYGKDVFLHKAEIGGVADLYKQRKAVEVKNGDWVEFSVEISRGKPRARDVMKVDAPEEYRNAPKATGAPWAGGAGPGPGGGGPPGGGGCGGGDAGGLSEARAAGSGGRHRSRSRSRRRD